MSIINVLFTRTYDGDYIADFSCNNSDLPKTNTFGYKVISDDELAALRSAAPERDAEVERAVQAEREEIEKAVVKAIMKIKTGAQEARDWTLADLRGLCASVAQDAIRSRGEKGK